MPSVGGANPFPPPPMMDTNDHEAVMRFAGECVRESEVQRRRAELVKQLQEAEMEDEREKLRVSCGGSCTLECWGWGGCCGVC